jgi:hypothetical protein
MVGFRGHGGRTPRNLRKYVKIENLRYLGNCSRIQKFQEKGEKKENMREQGET